jgi:glycosyltransferase involved in cell wall biosynthesis
MSAATMKKVLFLYTEVAPYFIASVERLVEEHDVEVHIVRWPVNKEAPFVMRTSGRIVLHERDSFNDISLRRFANELASHLVLASGWVDKVYLQVCRDAHRRGVPTVMCSDTAWRGGLRQWAAVGAARFWLPRTFSHAWVTGEAQALYAEYLGFARDRIKRGFYAADVDRFAPMAKQLSASKHVKFPHRFLCVARYIPAKGHQYMVEAFAELCDANGAGDWELWCIGIGALHPLEHSHPRIRHLGFVQAKDKWKYMEQSGVFILPSLYEPWGVVVHEHAAAGFPLVLSKAVGARHRFLKDGQNGHCFIAGDKESLKETFRKVIATSDADLVAMGLRSAELAKDWGPSQWAAVVMDLMNDHSG